MELGAGAEFNSQKRGDLAPLNVKNSFDSIACFMEAWTEDRTLRYRNDNGDGLCVVRLGVFSFSSPAFSIVSCFATKPAF